MSFHRNTDSSFAIERMPKLGHDAVTFANSVIRRNLSHPDSVKNLSPEDAKHYFEQSLEIRSQQSFWDEYQLDNSSDIRPDVYDIFNKWIDKIREAKQGACGEYSLLALYYLYNIIQKDSSLFMLDAEIAELEDEDHVFVRLFLKNTDQNDKISQHEEKEELDHAKWSKDSEVLNRSVIVDAWANDVYIAKEIPKKMKGLATDDDGIPVLTDYDSKRTLITDQGLTVSLLKESQLFLAHEAQKRASIATLKTLDQKSVKGNTKVSAAPLRPLGQNSQAGQDDTSKPFSLRK